MATHEERAWLYQAIGENVGDAFVFADREGRIRLWNAGAEQMFGFSAAEALGESLDLIVPERLRARHWEGYRQVMASGNTRYGTELLSVPALRRDGSTISVEFTIALVRSPEGEILGTGAVMRDITARFAELKALRKRVADLGG